MVPIGHGGHSAHQVHGGGPPLQNTPSGPNSLSASGGLNQTNNKSAVVVILH